MFCDVVFIMADSYLSLLHESPSRGIRSCNILVG